MKTLCRHFLILFLSKLFCSATLSADGAGGGGSSGGGFNIGVSDRSSYRYRMQNSRTDVVIAILVFTGVATGVCLLFVGKHSCQIVNVAFMLRRPGHYLPRLQELTRDAEFSSREDRNRMLRQLRKMIDKKDVIDHYVIAVDRRGYAYEKAGDVQTLWSDQMRMAEEPATDNEMPLSTSDSVCLVSVLVAVNFGHSWSSKPNPISCLRQMASIPPPIVYFLYAPSIGEELSSRQAQQILREWKEQNPSTASRGSSI